MKKIIFFLTVLTAFFVSCTTTKPIKVDKLEDDVFVINRIVLTSDTIEPTDEELVQIFQSFPYSEICDYVEEKTGIVIDPYLIDNELIEGNIEYTVVCDAETEEIIKELPEWELNLETEEETSQFCELIFSMDQPDGFLSVCRA